MMYDLDPEDYTSGSYNQCWLTEHWYPNELLVLDINYPEFDMWSLLLKKMTLPMKRN